MKIRDYFVATVIAVGCTLLFSYLSPAPVQADAGESVGKIKAGRPDGVPKYTKRDVDESSVTRLCDKPGARTCMVVNQTNVRICIKATTDVTCGSTTINCTADNDIFSVEAGAAWTDVIAGDDTTVTSTLCGKMESAPTGDCAADELGCVYTSELK